MTPIHDLVSMLNHIVQRPQHRLHLIHQFQQLVWRSADTSEPPDTDENAAAEVLLDLAHDLDFYEPDPAKRSESPAFYGDERLEAEVQAALAKLTARRTAVPPE